MPERTKIGDVPESGWLDATTAQSSVRRTAGDLPASNDPPSSNEEESVPTVDFRDPAPRLEGEKFVLREEIDRGGSSRVVQAFDRELLRNVAIKMLLPTPEEDPHQVVRFAEEARINGQLEHPGIVPVYEFGMQQGGRRFLCMKRVEGENLEVALGRLGPARLEPDRLADLLQVFVKVCDAVSFAHSRGVVHRDLKPSNIMMADFGQVYVLDWGIAQLLPIASAGSRTVDLCGGEADRRQRDPPDRFVGTPLYMAPEQLRRAHDELDERTDVFALGATLYEILVGHPPLTPEIMRAHYMRQPAPPIVPPEDAFAGGRVPLELSRIALRALEYEPSRRYGSVGELKRDIERFQRGTWHLPRASFPAGSVVVSEGEAGNAAYVIVEGQCEAYRVENGAEIALRLMGPGEVFGETAVFSAKPRTASVKAVTDAVLLVVTAEALSQGVGLGSWVGAFVKALAERFREADERLRLLERRAHRPDDPPSR